MKKVSIFKISDESVLNEALQIRYVVFTLEKGVSTDVEIDGYDDLNNMCDHFMIKYNSSKVGTIRCLNINEDIIKIQRYCLLKEFRGLGIGRTVMEYIEKYYANQCKSKIVVDAKYDACGFYKKCGYSERSDTFVEAGIQHIKMEKVLDKI